jgi:predicted transcriptional regulator
MFAPVSAYDEFAEFIASPPTLEDVAHFRLSDELEARVNELLMANRTRAMTAEEQTELDEYVRVEHLMRMAKIRALAKLREA